ncbi:MAG: sulfatase-like hydrolase/transferase [Bacteroidota bacterium]
MKKLLFLSVFILLASCSEQKKQPDTKPNIVFIFADDMTYTAINSLGNKEIATPNLDKLVNSGATFTHAYNMGAWNGAVCVASRAMIISGRSVWEANEFRQEWIQGRSLEKTWGKLMEQAGYDTYMTGKWHVDAPAEQVFGQVVHERPGMPKRPQRCVLASKMASKIMGWRVMARKICAEGGRVNFFGYWPNARKAKCPA